jgi:hypothetical protein
MHGSTSLQAGQGKSAFAIAAVVSTQQGKQGGVLRNRHKLAIAEGPALGGEGEGKDPDFGNKWLGHKMWF